MALHPSTLALKIQWMEEPSGLQSMGSLRVGHDLATKQPKQQQTRSLHNKPETYEMQPLLSEMLY